MLADSGAEEGRAVRTVHRLDRRRQRDRLRRLPGDRREPVQGAGHAVLAGDQFGRLAFVGAAVDPDPAVRPWLGGDPADQFAVIADLPLAEFAGARAERRPAAAGVRHDQREPAPLNRSPAAALVSASGPGSRGASAR